MNLHKKIAFTTVLVAILAFSGTPSAMASTSGHDRSAFNSSAEVALQEKLSNIASTNGSARRFAHLGSCPSMGR